MSFFEYIYVSREGLGAAAATLLAWLKLLVLYGALAKAEPKTLRYRILHAAAE